MKNRLAALAISFALFPTMVACAESEKDSGFSQRQGAAIVNEVDEEPSASHVEQASAGNVRRVTNTVTQTETTTSADDTQPEVTSDENSSQVTTAPSVTTAKSATTTKNTTTAKVTASQKTTTAARTTTDKTTTKAADTTAKPATTVTAIQTTAAPVATEPPQLYLCGDVNLDGIVDLSDYIVLKRWLKDPVSYPLTKQQLTNADFYNTGDGVDDMDAEAIYEYYNNSSALRW